MDAKIKEKNTATEGLPAPSGGTGTDVLRKPRKISVIEVDWNPLTELWSEVYIVGEEPYGFPSLLSRARCREAKELHKADFVLFTGGWPDVSPALYGETNHHKTFVDPAADVRDIQVFQEAAYLGIPMVGVCRGAQFLHVMNHGKLYQDVDNHNGKKHDIFLPKTEEYVGPVSSVHHQMCRPNLANGMDVIAVAFESEVKWLNEDLCYKGLSKAGDEDIEAFWYPETACFGVQGHPEYSGFDEYTLWFTDMIEEHIILNTDIELTNGRRRLKQEVMERRKWHLPDSVYKFLKDHA